MMEKMTYVKALEMAIACEALSEEVREKLNALREQQVKRNSAEKKPTKTQQENEHLKVAMLDAMARKGEPTTIKELMVFMGLDPMQTSTQKVSALMTQLVKAEQVEREVVKHVAYFKVAGA